MEKIKVGILFGGMSEEHDVSIMSATAIYKNIDRDKFSTELFYINKKGQWQKVEENDLMNKQFPDKNFSPFIPWDCPGLSLNDHIDIYFPILHGPNGEDGKVQCLFELSGKPYVGANSFSSALAMDKVVSKTLFQKAGLLTADFLFFVRNDLNMIRDKVKGDLGYPVFVKPCSLGSSVGISKVSEESELKNAVDLAFRHDTKIIIEKAIDAREIEISVMGNETIKISRPGELIPHNEFYDYEDKYIAGKTQFNIPATLDPQIEKKVVEMARKAFLSHFLNGMSRIDFLLEKGTHAVLISEINTIPGFTEISMFPKLWQLEGITFTELITRLIDFGFEYHERIN